MLLGDETAAAARRYGAVSKKSELHFPTSGFGPKRKKEKWGSRLQQPELPGPAQRQNSQSKYRMQLERETRCYISTLSFASFLLLLRAGQSGVCSVVVNKRCDDPLQPFFPLFVAYFAAGWRAHRADCSAGSSQ